MHLKSDKANVCSSWSRDEKYKNHIVAGSLEPQMKSASENSQPRIIIYDIKKSDRNARQLLPVYKQPTKHFFRTIKWSRPIPTLFPMGAIVGLMENSEIVFWDPVKILFEKSDDSTANECLAFYDSSSDDPDGSMTNAIDFGLDGHIATSAGSCDRVSVYNLHKALEWSKDDSTQNFSDSEFENPFGTADLKWSPAAKTVLMSGNFDGSFSFFDTRVRDKVLHAANETYNQCVTSMSWNQKLAFQFVASHSEGYAATWDLRKCDQPLAQLQDNCFSVVDWSPFDSKLILAASTDKTWSLWKSDDGSLLEKNRLDCERDIQWSPSTNTLFSACSDTMISVHKLNKSIRNYTPEWSKSFNELNTGINLLEMQPAESINDRISVFNEILENRKLDEYCSDMVNLCSQYTEENIEQEKTLWRFIQILFKDQKKDAFLTEISKSHTSSTSPITLSLNNEATEENPLTFFEKLLPKTNKGVAGQRTKKEDENWEETTNNGDNDPRDNNTDLTAESRDTGSEHGESLLSEQETYRKLQHFLVIGEMQQAVDLCIKTKNYAEALIISATDEEVFHRTQESFLKTHKNEFIRNIYSLILMNQMVEFIEKSSIENWKQTLTMILAYSKKSEYRKCCDQLAAKLEKNSKLFESLLCYICASNIDKITEKLLSYKQRDGLDYQDAIEKILICAKAILKNKTTPVVENVILEYAKVVSDADIEVFKLVSHFFPSVDSISNPQLMILYPNLQQSAEIARVQQLSQIPKTSFQRNSSQYATKSPIPPQNPSSNFQVSYAQQPQQLPPGGPRTYTSFGSAANTENAENFYPAQPMPKRIDPNFAPRLRNPAATLPQGMQQQQRLPILRPEQNLVESRRTVLPQARPQAAVKLQPQQVPTITPQPNDNNDWSYQNQNYIQQRQKPSQQPQTQFKPALPPRPFKTSQAPTNFSQEENQYSGEQLQRNQYSRANAQNQIPSRALPLPQVRNNAAVDNRQQQEYLQQEENKRREQDFQQQEKRRQEEDRLREEESQRKKIAAEQQAAKEEKLRQQQLQQQMQMQQQQLEQQQLQQQQFEQQQMQQMQQQQLEQQQIHQMQQQQQQTMQQRQAHQQSREVEHTYQASSAQQFHSSHPQEPPMGRQKLLPQKIQRMVKIPSTSGPQTGAQEMQFSNTTRDGFVEGAGLNSPGLMHNKSSGILTTKKKLVRSAVTMPTESSSNPLEVFDDLAALNPLYQNVLQNLKHVFVPVYNTVEVKNQKKKMSEILEYIKQLRTEMEQNTISEPVINLSEEIIEALETKNFNQSKHLMQKFSEIDNEYENNTMHKILKNMIIAMPKMK